LWWPECCHLLRSGALGSGVVLRAPPSWMDFMLLGKRQEGASDPAAVWEHRERHINEALTRWWIWLSWFLTFQPPELGVSHEFLLFLSCAVKVFCHNSLNG
jgi:hypothetical protein